MVLLIGRPSEFRVTMNIIMILEIFAVIDIDH